MSRMGCLQKVTGAIFHLWQHGPCVDSCYFVYRRNPDVTYSAFHCVLMDYYHTCVELNYERRTVQGSLMMVKRRTSPDSALHSNIAQQHCTAAYYWAANAHAYFGCCPDSTVSPCSCLALHLAVLSC